MPDVSLTPFLKPYVVTILLVTLGVAVFYAAFPRLPSAPAIALPVVFITAMDAGRKFALVAGRAMLWQERLRFSAIAAALQVGLCLLAVALMLLTERQVIAAIHPSGILLVAALTGAVGFVPTFAGLGFGAARALRKPQA